MSEFLTSLPQKGRFTVRLLLFCLLFLLISEMGIRVFIPTSDPLASIADSHYLIKRYDPSQYHEGRRVSGNLAQIIGRWRVNNLGYLSEIDFSPDSIRVKPAIGLIGDSHVEAFQVDFNRQMSAFLQSEFGDSILVYRYGRSGWAFSQYLHQTRVAMAEVSLDAIIYLCAPEDIWNSDYSINHTPFNVLLKITPTGIQETTPVIEQRSTLELRLMHSAILRYLVWNRKFDFATGLHRKSVKLIQNSAPPTNHSSYDDEQKMRMITDYIVGSLRREFLGTPILFVIKPENDRAPEEEAILRMIVRAAATNNCGYLDLTSAFKTASEQGIKVRFEGDSHFTEAGHQVAAKAIKDYLSSWEEFRSNFRLSPDPLFDRQESAR